MGVFLILLGVAAAITISALFVWVLIMVFRGKDEKSDDILFKNFMPQYSKGHGEGSVIEFVRGGDRTGIKFMPRDINFVKLLKDNEKIVIKPQLIWFENDKLIHFPKGTFSDHRHQLWGLPPNAEDLNDNIKKSPYGKALMSILEETNTSREETQVLRKRIIAQNKLVNKTEGLELVEDFMNKNKEIWKDVSSIYSDTKKGGHTYGPVGGSSQS